MKIREHNGKKLIGAGVVALLLCVNHHALAANRTWNDGGGANTNWNVGANWGGTAPVSGSDSLTFAGVAGLTNFNNFAANSQFNGFTFSSTAGAFLLQGNTVNLGGDIVNNSATLQTINLGLNLTASRNLNAASGNITINSVISQNSSGLGITKQGSGVVTLGGSSANTYSGLTTVSAGELDLNKTAGVDAIGAGGLTLGAATVTVKLLAANQINNNAAVTINGGTLNLNGNSETIDALGGSGGTITNSSGSASVLTIGANNGGTTYSGTIKDGAGTIALIKNGTGTETLSGNSSYSGGTTINGGTISAGSSTALGAGGLTMNGGTLELNGNNISLANLSGTGGTVRESANSGATLTVGSDNTNTTFAGNLSDDGNGNRHMSFTKTGTSVLTLSGVDDYTGSSTINGGVLRINGASALSSVNLTINGGVLELQNPGNFTRALGTGGSQVQITGGVSGFSAFGGTRYVSIGGAGTTLTWGGAQFNPSVLVLDETSADSTLIFSNAVNLANANRAINVNAATAIMTGVITNNAGAAAGLTKDGDGTLVLQRADNAYNGTNIINGGVLSVATLANGGVKSGIGNSGSQAAALVLNGGTLQYTGGSVSIDRLFSVGTAGGAIDASGSGALTFNNTGNMGFSGTGPRTLTLTGTNTGNNTLAVVIADNSGATTLIKDGAGTWVISGTNTYSGDTTITSGTLKLGAGNALPGGSGKGNVNVNSTLDMGGFADSVNGLSGSGIVDNSGGATTLTIGNNNASSIFSGIIKNSGGALALTKAGTGIITLSGTSGNTYTGVTTVNAGTLVLSKASPNAIPGALVIGDGAGVDTVQLGASDQIADTSAVTVNSSGVLDLNNFSDRVSSVAMTGGSVLTGTGRLTLGGNVIGNTNASTATISGNLDLRGTTHAFAIADGTAAIDMRVSAVITNGGLVKTGLGTLEFTAANRYDGGTTISNGTLRVNNTTGSGTGTGTVTIESGGTLGGTGMVSGAIVVEVGGTLAMGNSVGTLQAGSLMLQPAGTLEVEVASLSSYDKLTLTGSATLGGSLDIVLLAGYTPNLGDSFTIITDNGSVAGAFTSITDGFSCSIADNGDVIVTAVPEPGSLALVMWGLGLVVLVLHRSR